MGQLIQNVLDNLAAAYEELGETDQLAAAWGRRALLPNTERIIQWVQMVRIRAVRKYFGRDFLLCSTHPFLHFLLF